MMSCVPRRICSWFRSSTGREDDGHDAVEERVGELTYVIALTPDGVPTPQQPPCSKIILLSVCSEPGKIGNTAPPRSEVILLRLCSLPAKMENTLLFTKKEIDGCCNVQRLHGAGNPKTALALLKHKTSQSYLAVQDHNVVCIPLQADDPSFHLALDIYGGKEMSPKSKYIANGKEKEPYVTVYAIHQPSTVGFVPDSATSESFYLCSAADAETLIVELKNACNLQVLPTDTSRQFFYYIPVEDSSCFCLESTSKPGNFICVEDNQVVLKKTTPANDNTHFMKHFI